MILTKTFIFSSLLVTFKRNTIFQSALLKTVSMSYTLIFILIININKHINLRNIQYAIGEQKISWVDTVDRCIYDSTILGFVPPLCESCWNSFRFFFIPSTWPWLASRKLFHDSGTVVCWLLFCSWYSFM